MRSRDLIVNLPGFPSGRRTRASTEREFSVVACFSSRHFTFLSRTLSRTGVSKSSPLDSADQPGFLSHQVDVAFIQDPVFLGGHVFCPVGRKTWLDYGSGGLDLGTLVWIKSKSLLDMINSIMV